MTAVNIAAGMRDTPVRMRLEGIWENSPPEPHRYWLSLSFRAWHASCFLICETRSKEVCMKNSGAASAEGAHGQI
jgi:hypothetical protein